MMENSVDSKEGLDYYNSRVEILFCCNALKESYR